MSALSKRPETMIDVYRLLPEGTPIQVINNKFYISPTPNFQHFSIVDSIVDQLKKIVLKNNIGRVIFAPVDVFLGDRSAVQPDVFYISNEKYNMIMEDGVYGAPDIVIEVLSKGNKNADLVKKKAVYEEFGVKEYFIVDPADKSAVTYYLENEKYIKQTQKKGKLVSKLLNAEITF